MLDSGSASLLDLSRLIVRANPTGVVPIPFGGLLVARGPSRRGGGGLLSALNCMFNRLTVWSFCPPSLVAWSSSSLLCLSTLVLPDVCCNE